MNEVLKAMAAQANKIFIKVLDGESIQLMNRLQNEELACNVAVNKLVKTFQLTREQLLAQLFTLNDLDKSHNYSIEKTKNGINLYDLGDKNAMQPKQLPVQEPSNENPVQELQPEQQQQVPQVQPLPPVPPAVSDT